MIPNGRGFSTVELIAALTIGALVLGGIGAALREFQTTPRRSLGEVGIHNQLRSASATIKQDVSNAESFEAGTSPVYGIFRWLDFSAFPPTRHRVEYLWDEKVLYRQEYIGNVAEPLLPLVHMIEVVGDVSYTVTTTVNPLIPTSTERLLTVSITVTSEDLSADQVDDFQQSTTLEVSLRPEQTNPIEYQYYFLHNKPTPPVAATNARVNLPLSSTIPTTTTLYNYDQDRNSDAGLTLVLSSAVDETDKTKQQDWRSDTLAQSITIVGRINLFLMGAADGFASGHKMLAIATFKDYDPGLDASTVIGNRAMAWFTSSAGWTQVTLKGNTVAYTLAAGHKIEVTVQFDTQSGADGMLAYDTTTLQAFLMLPTRP